MRRGRGRGGTTVREGFTNASVMVYLMHGHCILQKFNEHIYTRKLGRNDQLIVVKILCCEDDVAL